MERPFIFEILRFYRRIITKKPVVFIATVILALVVAISVNLTLIEEGTLSLLFSRKPELSISIGQTEEYVIESNKLIIQRIQINNRYRSLQKVKISISISIAESLKQTVFVSEPEVPFQLSSFKDDVGNVLIEITCDSFVENQTAEIRLVMSDFVLKSESSNIVVEIIGTYGRDKLIGTSATGTILLKSSEN